MIPKIIANYLPQYHAIPENDQWWGKGFTDWKAVKNAKPLFSGHIEPKEPLNDNYYDLSTKEAIKNQILIAKKYGIYGFGIYHYWFSDELHLLHKPAELILNNKDLDIPMMFIWDNSSWKRTWSNIKEFSNDWAPSFDEKKQTESNQSGLLAELKYGEKASWEKHFQYLLQFFMDDRYIKINNKPLFGLFCPKNDEGTLSQMIEYWNARAIENGFGGVAIIVTNEKQCSSFAEYSFIYEPIQHGWGEWANRSILDRIMNKIKSVINTNSRPLLYDYDVIWNKIIQDARNDIDKSLFYGAFVGYDDTPRRGKKGKVLLGATPAKFEHYLYELLKIAQYKNKEYMFLTAWNEWGEGAYLEPDKMYCYSYLEAVRNSISKLNK